MAPVGRRLVFGMCRWTGPPRWYVAFERNAICRSDTIVQHLAPLISNHGESNRASPELLGHLLSRHGAALVLYARQRCDCADDVVQEAFVQLARQQEIPHHPLAWLYRVVRNAALTASRADRRRRKHEGVAAERTSGWFEPGVHERLDADAAAAAIAHLPIDEREVIVAHLWGGLTFQQVAEVTGTSASTAHRRYEAGLRALRSRLASKPESV